MNMNKKITPYLSYWSGGYNGKPSEFVINMHKLSAYYAKQHFGEIHLITDSKSLPFFENIKFNSISVEFDHLDVEYKTIWAVSKLYAYKFLAEKNIPFIHIDYDVFLVGGLDKSFLSSPIFAQAIEINIKSFYDLKSFTKDCPKIYDLIDDDIDHAYNVGIFGGHDTEFISLYANKALDIILDPANKNFFTKHIIKDEKYFSKSVVLEQYYLAVLLKRYNKNITLLFKDGIWENNKTEARNKGYVHLLAGKNDQKIVNKINNMVEEYKL